MLKNEQYSYCHKRRKHFKYNLRFFKFKENHYEKPIYYFGDFEYNGYNNTFLSFQYHRYKGITEIFDKDIPKNFLALLEVLIKNELTIMFFHNLRYDINCLLKIFFSNEMDKTYKKLVRNKIGNANLTYLIRDNTGYMEISYKKHKLILVDSMIFFNISLDKTFKLLNIPSHKSHKNKMKWFKGIFQNEKDYNEFLKYAYDDVDKTDKIITYIDNFMKKNDINYSWLLSKASLSKKIFIKNDMPERYLFTKDLSAETFYILWNTYRGGFCRFFKDRVTRKKTILVYDIKSSYPYSMTYNFPSANNKVMDITKDISLEYDGLNYEDYTGCILFENIEIKYDLLPKFDKQQRLNYVKKGKDIFLSLEEFLLFKKKNIIRNFKIKYGYIWACSLPVYKDYIYKYYHKKETSKNDIERLFYKILLNSLYGSSVEKFEKDRLLIDDEEILNFQFGKLHSLVYASRITALSRCFLLEKIIDNYAHVFYVDTDSLFTDKIIETDTAIGGYELETTGSNLIVLGRKKYLLYSNKNKVKKLGSLGIGLKSKYYRKEISDRSIIQIYNYLIKNKMRYEYETISKVSRKFRNKLLLPNEVYLTDKLYGWDFTHKN